MAKSSIFKNSSFARKDVPTEFNLVNTSSNFHSVFDIKPLDQTESNQIEKLLVENFMPGKIPESQVPKDAKDLKILTSEIKSIGRQGIILMGERIKKAREILKPYRNGTFTQWMESTFGTKKTGYNMLSYYELYTSLGQDDLRESLKKIPQRTAYILASRAGDIKIKSEILKDFCDRSHNEIVILIQERLPLAKSTKKNSKTSNQRLIIIVHQIANKLSKRREALSASDKDSLQNLSKIFNNLSSEKIINL